MALYIRNLEVEQLVAELAQMTGENKTETIRRALEERKVRLGLQAIEGRRERLLRFLEREVWPNIPEDQKGRRRRRAAGEESLGYGPDGV